MFWSETMVYWFTPCNTRFSMFTMTGKGGHVLVVGDYRQTVTIIRSLARAGFRISLGTNERGSSTALSRYLSDAHVFDESNCDHFLDQLEVYLRREKPDFVFPVG